MLAKTMLQRAQNMQRTPMQKWLGLTSASTRFFASK